MCVAAVLAMLQHLSARLSSTKTAAEQETLQSSTTPPLCLPGPQKEALPAFFSRSANMSTDDNITLIVIVTTKVGKGELVHCPVAPLNCC